MNQSIVLSVKINGVFDLAYSILYTSTHASLFERCDDFNYLEIILLASSAFLVAELALVVGGCLLLQLASTI